MTKKSTENRLHEALQRLITRTPNAKELWLKVQAGKPLRITKSGVEKEAGLSNGALKHYPSIVEDIEEAEAIRVHGGSRTSQDLDTDDVKASPLYKQLEEKLESANKAKKAAEATVSELREECYRKDAALNEKTAELDEVIASMWELIPREQQRESIIEKTENIVRFPN